MKKLIKWIVLGVAGLLGLMVMGIAGTIMVDSLVGPSVDLYTNTSFTAADGVEVGAYVATPDEAGTYPAVLMIHEFWGLNEEITQMADMLAEEGYVVIVPDTYRGKSTNLVPRAIWLVINVDEARVDQDVLAAYKWLVTRDDVNAERVGVIGFCYGGGVSLRHATLNGEIVAAVNLYGDLITDPEQLGAVRDEGIPVLGIFGSEDARFPPDDVAAFDAALDAAGVPNIVNIYPGMPHAFVQPDVLDEPGEPRMAWLDILAFFDEYLKG